MKYIDGVDRSVAALYGIFLSILSKDKNTIYPLNYAG